MGVAIGTNVFLSCPLHTVRPAIAAYTGRFSCVTNLSVQSNWIGTVYFFCAVLATCFGFTFLEKVLVRLFPLTFGLGFFLTIAYYALDHFNPEAVKIRRSLFQKGYKYVYVVAHLEHVFALPAVVLYARNFNATPRSSDIVGLVGGYAVAYLA